MTTNLVKIANACAVEAERQQVGLPQLVDLLSAYEYAQRAFGSMNTPTNAEAIMRHIAWRIEPRTNSEYRITPVTFNNGGTSSDAKDVPDRVYALFSFLDFEGQMDQWFINDWIKQFLWIHPFVDGNGRTAFILYNWLMGSLDDPAPLPDFFG